MLRPGRLEVAAVDRLSPLFCGGRFSFLVGVPVAGTGVVSLTTLVTVGVLSHLLSGLSLRAEVGYMPHLPSLELRGGIGSCLTAGRPLLPGLGIRDGAGLPVPLPVPLLMAWEIGADTRRCSGTLSVGFAGGRLRSADSVAGEFETGSLLDWTRRE